jgi:hypothetical protein
MATATEISPTGWYDNDSLYSELGVSAQALARARRGGSLRFTRRGNRTLYFGKWVLAWLLGAEGNEVATGK